MVQGNQARSEAQQNVVGRARSVEQELQREAFRVLEQFAGVGARGQGCGSRNLTDTAPSWTWAGIDGLLAINRMVG